MNLNKLCVWGDSIAKGIVFDESRGRYAVCRENCISRISRDYNIEISNYSVMGQTSENGLARMRPQDMKQGGIAVVEYGGNDCDLDWRAVSEHPESRQDGKVPLDQFAKNIAEMISRIRSAGMHPLLVTPPPLVAKRYYEWVSKGLNSDNILGYLGDIQAIYFWQKAYADCISEIADKMKVKLLDIRSRFLENADYQELMCIDGIHPNEKGHALIYQAAAAML